MPPGFSCKSRCFAAPFALFLMLPYLEIGLSASAYCPSSEAVTVSITSEIEVTHLWINSFSDARPEKLSNLAVFGVFQ